MNSDVRRIFVEKKYGFNVDAEYLYKELKEDLEIPGLKSVRVLNRYDISGIDEDVYIKSRETIFSEPTVDNAYDEFINLNEEDKSFAVEYLPGQYDQRADSAAQCIEILTQNVRPAIRTARVIVLKGVISESEFDLIKKYCINPVDSREAMLGKPESLNIDMVIPEDVAIMDGFTSMDDDEIANMANINGYAMNFEDLKFCKEYFKNVEMRDPTITEIKVIDTYWSDHCRHTTFSTEIKNIDIEDGKYATPIKGALKEYIASRKFVYGDKDKDKDFCLMDIAVIGMKELKLRGMLNDIDESEEINACSIVVDVDVDVDGEIQKYLVMFKNETHNHPTEIEPFGGAATCLGGAIRDPLSGRSYVYQAMRVTGSGDPRAKIEDTIPGKLPQRKITTVAAHGYSSYGNQIGLATGSVTEIYDEGYIAKRMEIGAVIAAAPYENVVRETPRSGDAIILLGGRTGRDGCGGATGSSKAHTEESILTCGAEVQKGNPPTERKIQRLFRNPNVSKMIKRCNDFGAGGVSVAIGELSEGLEINLDLVSKKYEGLDGTELAISESQERMAVVISQENIERFIDFSHEENLEARVVAKVTGDRRLKMFWREKVIVDISRDFLDTNGAKQSMNVKVISPKGESYFKALSVDDLDIDLKSKWISKLGDLNICSQKGLIERFDSSIGASTVIMPFGGKYQLSPQEGMVSKIPLIKGETYTGTIMSYGYDPKISKWSPFHGAIYSVVEAVAKVVAMGGDYKNIRLTLQEYFEKLGKDPIRWGKPFSALLGALHAQKMFGTPAIGGKDSMSGSFKSLDVPPTLVTFAVNIVDVRNVVSTEFKTPNSKVILLPGLRDENELPDFNALKKNFDKVHELIQNGKILASNTIKFGGIAEAVSKMSFGNRIGLVFENDFDNNRLFAPDYGSIILEISDKENIGELFEGVNYIVIGRTQVNPIIKINEINISIDEILNAWQEPLEDIFPSKTDVKDDKIEPVLFNRNITIIPRCTFAKPRIYIPTFPGTNCECDSARAFEKAGGVTHIGVFRNINPSDIESSIEAMVKAINDSQIIMLPGGFSAGDEPEGSGKFIATVFRNPRVNEAVTNLLKNRDGLILGICNGFQALIKLGLLPYGEIRDIDENCPTLTYNEIGRHMSSMVQTKIVSKLSPWFSNVDLGEIHSIPISHGEGRFVAKDEIIQNLLKNGQIATQYVDFDGMPSVNMPFNPNGSAFAIEGITSPDGRIFGKMAHSERIGSNVAKNIPGNKDQKLFSAGVNYFK